MKTGMKPDPLSVPDEPPVPAPARRRLSDKILEAVQRAVQVGRKDIAARLKLIYDATIEDDARYRSNRRRGER